MPGQRGNAGTWCGRLAVPLMLWHSGFSSLGVSLASDHKATQEETYINHSGVPLYGLSAVAKQHGNFPNDKLCALSTEPG